MNLVTAEVLGERSPNIPPTKRDLKEADRIAGRALYSIRGGKLAFAVKGGRFGKNNTVHDSPVYDLVAQRLLATMDEIEISVIRISGVTGASGIQEPIEVGYADVISAKKIGGFTKYPSPNPSDHPEAFVDGSIGFGEVPCVAPFKLELMYPQPQIEPATTA